MPEYHPYPTLLLKCYSRKIRKHGLRNPIVDYDSAINQMAINIYKCISWASLMWNTKNEMSTSTQRGYQPNCGHILYRDWYRLVNNPKPRGSAHHPPPAGTILAFPPLPYNLSACTKAILGLTCHLITSSTRRRLEDNDEEHKDRALQVTLRKIRWKTSLAVDTHSRSCPPLCDWASQCCQVEVIKMG